jgi:hypothetical protein
VKRGLPGSQQMIDLIRREPYFDPYSGRQLDVNYLDDKRIDCSDAEVRITAKD